MGPTLSILLVRCLTVATVAVILHLQSMNVHQNKPSCHKRSPSCHQACKLWCHTDSNSYVCVYTVWELPKLWILLYWSTKSKFIKPLHLKLKKVGHKIGQVSRVCVCVCVCVCIYIYIYIYMRFVGQTVCVTERKRKRKRETQYDSVYDKANISSTTVSMRTYSSTDWYTMNIQTHMHK